MICSQARTGRKQLKKGGENLFYPHKLLDKQKNKNKKKEGEQILFVGKGGGGGHEVLYTSLHFHENFD
jgi:dihydroxyacetone kinase